MGFDLLWEWQKSAASRPTQRLTFQEYSRLVEAFGKVAMTLERNVIEPTLTPCECPDDIDAIFERLQE